MGIRISDDGVVHKQVYVVMKESKGVEGRSVWVFTDHAAALRCRRQNKLDSHQLWGCAVDCYKFSERG